MRECDVVMKGGITSGVVYPLALVEFSRSYRLHSLGGASAGAIGAALGAAAEFGRDGGGFDRLAGVPGQLADGRLAALFQPQPSTRPLLPLLLAATGHDQPGAAKQGMTRVLAILGAAVTGFPLASVLGILPGFLLALWGGAAGGPLASRIVLVVLGAVLAVLGWLVAVLVRLGSVLSTDVPANQFGICRGLGTGAGPGFTDWLAGQVDDLAGLAPAERPLTFGQLRGRDIDLRMISTCLSLGRPFELPWEAGGFFFDPVTWAGLFPATVMDALLAAPPARPADGGASAVRAWEQDEVQAAGLVPPLRRLPAAEHLPVIVATRLSLSFPLLISAVPLWTIDRRAKDGPRFVQVWFTDGGLCSNFPVQLFDAALPIRPTFAINLGDFAEGVEPSPDQALNIEYATSNRSGLLPEFAEVPVSGWRAVAGFALAAVDTARSWPDGTQLNLPGYRDRIVRVLQSPSEGGLNLYMDGETIARLADRGRVAAAALVAQFTEPRYPESAPVASGWDNHRWVRYRALLSGLPVWMASYRHGRDGLDALAADPPSYAFSASGRALAADLTTKLDALADALDTTDGAPSEAAVKNVAGAPAPVGVIRRVPRI
ncbi:MAG: patatin-like phospholipase family protein [Actinobacteria bacterium]|nr:patatin-like phospholipase family protein [Actinomycetota bacterium]